MNWTEITQHPQFQSLGHVDKLKIWKGYFSDNIASEPEYISLPENDKQTIKTNMLKEGGLITKPETSLIKDIAKTVGMTGLGIGETLMSAGSGMAGTAAGALAAGTTAIPEWMGLFPKGTSQKTLEKVADFLTYKPMTEAGQRGVGAVSYPFEKINQLADYLGDRELKNRLAIGDSPDEASTFATSINLAVKAIPFMLAKKQNLTKTISGKILPPEMVTKEPVIDSPDISPQPAYRRADITPKGYVHDLEVVEPPPQGQLPPTPERLLLQEPQTKRLPSSPITYGDNFVAMPPEIAPEIKYPYAGQKRLPPATDFEVTPEGQGINIKGQEAISRVEPTQILFENLTKPQAIYQQTKRFKETGIKPEVRQNINDGSYYVYETKPIFDTSKEVIPNGKAEGQGEGLLNSPEQTQTPPEQGGVVKPDFGDLKTREFDEVNLNIIRNVNKNKPSFIKNGEMYPKEFTIDNNNFSFIGSRGKHRGTNVAEINKWTLIDTTNNKILLEMSGKEPSINDLLKGYDAALKSIKSKTPQPFNHENLDTGVPDKASIDLQNSSPDIKPVTKITLDNFTELKAKGEIGKGKTVFRPPKSNTVYVIDNDTIHDIMGGKNKAESIRLAKQELMKGGDSESRLLGYANREGIPQEDLITGVVTKEGEAIVGDTPENVQRIREEAQKRNLVFGNEGELKDVTEKVNKVGGVVKPEQGNVTSRMGEKFNSITIGEAKEMLKNGDPQFIEELKSAIQEKGKTEAEHITRNLEGIIVGGTSKTERPQVINNIKKIEPEINQVLEGKTEIPQLPPLMQEVKKYKKVYFGSEREFTNEIVDAGLPTSQNKSIAKRFGKVINERYISPDAKIIKWDDIPQDIRFQSIGYDIIEAPAKWARKEGFDVLDVSNSSEQEFRILNPNVLKTKAEIPQTQPKEAWQMTRDEWADYVLKNAKDKITGKTKILDAEARFIEKKYHESQVRNAYFKGKPVPEFNLKEYGLQKSQPPIEQAKIGELPPEEYPIISTIRNMGGINPRRAGGMAGELKRYSIKEGFNLLNKDGVPLETAFKGLQEKGLLQRDADFQDLFDSIDAEIKGKGIKTLAQQEAEWAKTPEKIKANELSVGDKFTEEGHTKRVTEINPDTEKIKLENGGTKIIDPNKTIYIDRGSLEHTIDTERPVFELTPQETSTKNPSEFQPEMFGVERKMPDSKLQGKVKQKEGFEMADEIARQEAEGRQIKIGEAPIVEAHTNINGNIEETPTQPYQIGSTVRVGKSLTPHEITKEIEQTAQEKQLGEKFYEVKNLKTGEIGIYDINSLTPIHLKDVKNNVKIPEQMSDVRKKWFYKPVKGEKGEASLDLLVPELPTTEDIKYLKPIARPIITPDDKKDFEKELDNFFIGLWDRFKSGLEKDVENIRIAKERGSKETEAQVISDSVLLGGGLTSVLKSGVKTSVNPLRGLAWSIANKVLPNSVIEFFKPFASMTQGEQFLKNRTTLGGTLKRVGLAIGKVSDELNKFTDTELDDIGRVLRGDANISILSPEAQKSAKKMRNLLDFAGKQMVNQERLAKEIYEANKGKYVPNIYAKHLIKDEDLIKGIGKKLSDEGYLKGRMDAVIKEAGTVKEYVDKNIYDGLLEVANKLGIDHERVLSAGRGKLGYSLQGANEIVTQQATELSVLAHEIGHQLDHKYNLWQRIVKDAIGYGKSGQVTASASAKQRGLIQNELRTLADLTWEGQEVSTYFKTKVRKTEEKMAHILEGYIHAPEKFKEVAPNVYKAFDDFIKSEEILKPLSEIKQGLSLLKNEIKGYQVVSKAGKPYSKAGLTLEKATEIQAKTQAQIENYRKEIGLLDNAKAILARTGEMLTDNVKYSYYDTIAKNPNWTWQPSIIKVADKKYTIKELIQETDIAEKVAEQVKSPETIRRAEMLRDALNEAQTVSGNIPKGFMAMPDNKRYGSLSGAVVKEQIAKDILPIMESSRDDIGKLAKIAYSIEKLSAKGTAVFKMMKTGFNPPTAVRNIVSNAIQLNMKGMNIPTIAYRTQEALLKMGQSSPEYIKAMRGGLFDNNWSVAEISDLLDHFKTTKDGLDLFGKLGGMAKWYGNIDDVFKFASYLDDVAKGMKSEDAIQQALKWGMDYTLASRSVKALRRHAIPFLSYQYKIAPLVAETLIERPWVIGKYLAIPSLVEAYIKSNENITDKEWEKLNKELPMYIKNTGSYMVAPFKSEDGKTQWVNLEYFFPWGNFKDMYQSMNKGDVIEGGLGMVNNPFLNSFFGLKLHKDPFSGKPIYNKLDSPTEQASKTVAFLINQFSPPVTALDSLTELGQGAAGYTKKYFTGEKDRYNRQVSGLQAVGRWFGVNLIEPSPQQTIAEKKFRLAEIEAEYRRIMRDPNIRTNPQKAKSYRDRWIEERKNIIQGNTLEYIPTEKLKGIYQPYVDWGMRELQKSYGRGE